MSAPSARPAAGKSDWGMVLSKFFQHGTTIASVAPSSKYLARMMLRGIDFAAAKCIVELGAGTGPITKELLRRVGPDTRLLVVERDADFCKRLRQKFPHAEVVEGDACDIQKLVADRGISQVDEVVSGLPLPSFPADVQSAILGGSAKVLRPGGLFRQLTYMPFVYWKFYRGFYADVRFKLVPLNIPPAGVYFCGGYRGDQPAA
jgi:phospholipid N-methyltransferase